MVTVLLGSRDIVVGRQGYIVEVHVDVSSLAVLNITGAQPSGAFIALGQVLPDALDRAG